MRIRVKQEGNHHGRNTEAKEEVDMSLGTCIKFSKIICFAFKKLIILVVVKCLAEHLGPGNEYPSDSRNCKIC